METKFEFRDFAKVFAMGILIYAVLVLIFSLMPTLPDLIESWHPTAAFIVNYTLQLIVLFFPLWFFVIRKYAANFSDFGFAKVPLSKMLKTIFSSYFFYIVVTVIISSLLYVEQIEIPGYKAQEAHLPLFGDDLIGIISAVGFIVFAAPILEEIFFRGFVYRVLTKTWPIWFGSIISALLFALFHFEFQSFIPLFFLGLLLNYNYQKTLSLWTSIGFHFFNNAFAFAIEIYLYYNPEALKDVLTPLGFLMRQ